jgi:uncharacterized protein (TIGR02145 family)
MYCWCENKIVNKNDYGALYDNNAMQTGMIAPSGWRIPTGQDFITLSGFLINNGFNWDKSTDSSRVAKSLASKTSDWESSTVPGAVGNNVNTNNKSGFSARPAGIRMNGDIPFQGFGKGAVWWSSTVAVPGIAMYTATLLNDSEKFEYNKAVYGMFGRFASIRLIRE